MSDSPQSQPTATLRSRFLTELTWRGLFNQCTDLAGLDKHLADAEQPGSPPGGRRAYIGFDPTADSLTIGNLVQIMVLAHFQRAGHTPIVLLGGATGLIGDPSGKSAERTLSDKSVVEGRAAAQSRIFGRVLTFGQATPNAARMFNNIDWLGKLSYLDALRDIGKHFSINMMLQKDSVKERLHNREQGISYTEFSYMILQSYDYLHLWEHENVTLQMSGSDQWGNIVGGVDLIGRKVRLDFENHAAAQLWDKAKAEHHWTTLAHSRQAFGLTTPLLAKSDGGKFGKTEKGAIWLSAPDAARGETASTPGRTTPYALYQYLLNLADADTGKFLRIFTFLTQPEVLDIEARHAADPGQRLAQRTIAHSMVAMLHGEVEAEAAAAAARALFSGDIATLPEDTLREVFADAPASTHPRSSLDPEGADLIDLLVATALATSKKQAREFLATNAVTINGQPAPADHRLRPAHLLHNSLIAIRRGKKNWHLTMWR